MQVRHRPAIAPSSAAALSQGAPAARSKAPAADFAPVPADRALPSSTGLPRQLGALFGFVPRLSTIAVAAALAGCVSPGGPGGPLSPPAAHRQIEGVGIQLAPGAASPTEKHAHYARIVAAAGGHYRPGEVHVLALRGLDPSSGRVRDASAQSSLRDTIVVLKPGTDGRPIALEMAGSTYPGAPRPDVSRGPDVTGDGRGDVGMVREGNFRTVPNGNAFGGPSYWVLRHGGGDGLPGVRDTDQNGTYSADEYAASRRRGDRLHEVLFHPPYTFASGSVAVNSIGCWNVENYDRFVEVLGGPNARFDVTLLDAYAAR